MNTAILLFSFVAAMAQTDAGAPDAAPPAVAASTADVMTLNQGIVDACANAVTDTTPQKVRSQFKQLCYKATRPGENDIYSQLPVSYTLTREEDSGTKTHFTISQKIRFNILPAKTTPRRAAEMLAKAKECRQVVSGFWQRYGIKFNLEFDSNRATTPGDPDDVVTLQDQQCRSHAQQFCFGGLENGARAICDDKCKLLPKSLILDARGACLQACEQEVRQNEFCLTVLHEVGHLVGLPDEYKDEFACKDRPLEDIHEEQDPASVMAIPMYGFIDLFDKFQLRQAMGMKNAIEFFPRHIRKVLAPYAACATPAN